MDEFRVAEDEVVLDMEIWDKIVELLALMGDPTGLAVEDAGRAIVMARDLWEEINA